MEKKRQEISVLDDTRVGNSGHGPGICPTSAWLSDLETSHSTSLSLNFPICRMDNIIHSTVFGLLGGSQWWYAWHTVSQWMSILTASLLLDALSEEYILFSSLRRQLSEQGSQWSVRCSSVSCTSKLPRCCLSDWEACHTATWRSHTCSFYELLLHICHGSQ